MKSLILITVCVLFSAALAANYAVLVAGSNTFDNYRHQSDVCHAYQILIKNGMSADNIIVMMYDDVADSYENPLRGKLINKKDGVDNYAGCTIDYKKHEVKPKNFLGVIKGNKSEVHGGTGRVLEAGPNDDVFIYFTDHGATGLIAFPSEYLYADELIKALDEMTKKQKFNKLVFYLEACESGSMFQDLATNTRIYATTAANPDESSWAYYCSPDDVVNGTEIGSCLGDEYSVRWMEDSDRGLMNSETLQDQFTIVKNLTLESHVMQYGDQSFSSDVIGKYQSGQATATAAKRATRKLRIGEEVYEVPQKGSRVDSRDVRLINLLR